MVGLRRVSRAFVLIALLLLAAIASSCGPTNSESNSSGAAATDTPAVSTLPASTTVTPSAGTNAPTDQRTITVTGIGVVSVVPDTAEASIGATAADASVTVALQDVDDRMTAVINVLHDNGIADEQIKTIVFDVMAQYDYSSESHPIIGYSVTHLVRFSVSPAERVGDIIGAAVDAGANQVSGVVFTTGDPSAATQQAREKAMTDALVRAQQFAKAANLQVGAPISITEGTLVTPIVDASAGAAVGGGPALVEAGLQEIEVDVTVTYELK